MSSEAAELVFGILPNLNHDFKEFKLDLIITVLILDM